MSRVFALIFCVGLIGCDGLLTKPVGPNATPVVVGGKIDPLDMFSAWADAIDANPPTITLASELTRQVSLAKRNGWLSDSDVLKYSAAISDSMKERTLTKADSSALRAIK